MSVLNINDTLMLIIDMQEKLVNAVFNKNIIINNAKIISKSAKILNIPCVITEQYPKGLGNTIPEISENTDSIKFEKFSFNALDNVDILNQIKKYNKKQVIIAGIETHICVRQTAAALLNTGYDVTIIKDCCGSRLEDEYLTGLDIMKQEGCFIKTTEMALFELLKTAKHPNFKEIQSFIK